MRKNILIHFIFFIIILKLTITQWSSPGCTSTLKTQSPVNILSNSTLYYEEHFFRILTNNYGPLPTTTKWEQFVDQKAVGFRVNSTASKIQIAKDWSVYQYSLSQVLFKSSSEHQIDGNSFDVEMQLIHTLDTSFKGLGRKKSIPINNLVISLFFHRNSSSFSDKIFDYLNLSTFAQGTEIAYLKRPVKLGNLIQHMPSYLYQGTLPYGNCDDTFWIIMTQYGVISELDYTNLNKALETPLFKLITSPTNGRSINPFFQSKNVLRNYDSLTWYKPNPSYFKYNKSSILSFGGLLLGLIFLLLD